MKRKPSKGRRLVSQERIEQAKWAKSHGLLSKRAKLGQHRLSYRVATKIAALESLRAIPTFERPAGAKISRVLDPAIRGLVKISPKKVKEYRAAGFQIFNNRLITPSRNTRRVRDALAQGRPGGVTTAGLFVPRPTGPPRRVSEGIAERIQLSLFGIRNFRDLFEALKEGKLQAFGKDPSESWSFRLYDFNFRPGRHKDIQEAGQEAPDLYELRFLVLRDDKTLLEYLTRYQNISDCGNEEEPGEGCEELFQSFELFRLHDGDSLGATPDKVYEDFRRRRNQRIYKRRPKKAKPARIKRPAQSREEFLRKAKEYYVRYYAEKADLIKERDARRKQRDNAQFLNLRGKPKQRRKRKYD